MSQVSSPFRLLFITNSSEVAGFVCRNGVDRVFVDLEVLGKDARQGHLDTVISRHEMADVRRLRPVVPAGGLLVRLNPLHPGIHGEVQAAIEFGADTLMLPMFRGPSEVEAFSQLVDGRASVCLLVETIGAMNSLADCIAVKGVSEVHIGLNDLHLEMERRFMFEPLADGQVDEMAVTLRKAGVPFGVGGIARVGEGVLPAELLLAEHARIGSTGAILSRTFHRQAQSVQDIVDQMDFAEETQRIRDSYHRHCRASGQELSARHTEVQEIVRRIAAVMPERRRGESRGSA